MANIDHKAALKAAKKRVHYLKNRERILADAKAKRVAAKAAAATPATPVTKTVTITEVNGKYVLELNGTKLVLSADNQVTVEKAKSITVTAPTTSASVELKPNGQPYKTSAAQRAAVKKWEAKNPTYHREYAKTETGKRVAKTASKRYREANQDAIKAYKREYYQANKETILANNKARYAARKEASTSKLPALNTATLVPFGQYDVSEFSMIRNITK